jgi:predicted transcriptional regulator
MTKLADQPKTIYSLRANVSMELAERLKKIAQEEEDTLSRLVRRAVRRYVDEYESPEAAVAPSKNR